VAEQEEFIRRMGDLATYWVKAINFDLNKLAAIPETEGVPEPHRKQAALCVLYLKDATQNGKHSFKSLYALL